MLIKSGIMTSGSGSLGGITASHNSGGLYLRARTIPTDPNSIYQQAVRGHMSSLTSIWGNTLTAVQRTAWETYAANVPVVNPLGDQIHISGLNHFVRSNVPRLQASLARVSDAPTTFNLGDFTTPIGFSFDSASTELDVVFENTDDWANEDDAAMLVRNSRQQGPTINFFKGPYRYTSKIEGDSVTPPTSPAALTSPFACAAGNVSFAIAVVSRADGRLSAPFRGPGLGA